MQLSKDIAIKMCNTILVFILDLIRLGIILELIEKLQLKLNYNFHQIYWLILMFILDLQQFLVLRFYSLFSRSNNQF